jgi:tetratricopeptide (TPR) repeat protein
MDVAERSVAVFEELHDELGLVRAWRLKGQAHYLDRSARISAEASEEALRHARLAGDSFEEREIAEWLVIALLLGPAPAAAASRRCRELSREFAGVPLLQAEIIATLASLEAMLGHLEEAMALIDHVEETTRSLGEWNWLAIWHAFVFLWLDDPISAELTLLPAYAALKQMGEKSHFSTIVHALSHALYMQGRYEEAEDLTHECEEAARPNDVHSQISWRSVRAKALARMGEHEQAERLAREALAYAEASDFLLAHAEALADLGEVLGIVGRPWEAAEAYRTALKVYARKGNELANGRRS